MSAQDTLTARTVARRFWVMNFLILSLALLTSALAVRYVALPFFKDYQYNAIRAQAEDTALHLDGLLSHNDTLLSVVAQDPHLIDIALGLEDNSEYLPDLLAALRLPEDLSWVSFYDAFATELSDFARRPEERRLFSRAALNDLVTSTLDGTLKSRRPVLLQTRGEDNFLILATPVLHQGFVEGVLLSGYRLHTTDIYPRNEIVKSTHLILPLNGLLRKNSAVVSPLRNFALSVALVPDEAAVQKAGTAVLANSMGAISVVLVGAFALFVLAGKAVIVGPHRALEEKQAKLSELAAIAERANDAIQITDLDGKLIWANPAFEQLTGHHVEDVRGMTPAAFLQGPETDADTRRRIRCAMEARQAIQVEMLNYHSDGSTYWISLSISPLKTNKGRHYGYMAISNDISEARAQREAVLAAKQEIEVQALHDALTGLPNRRLLDQTLKDNDRAEAGATTIIRIDLDHFKYVNDTMGHDAGDHVLCEVARILKEETKTSDLASRVGGDEFLLLLAPGATSEEGVHLAERMLERIKTPKIFDGKSIRIGASFGVASTADGLLSRDQLIIGADAALYEAKESGRNRIRVYAPDLHQSVLARRGLARKMRKALAQGEFEPYFQPQFDARTHEIVGVETLARWHSRELGLLMPNEFLPVAEQLSVVEDIDNQIFTKALEQIDSLRTSGIMIPRVSVNVTVDRIRSDEVYERIRSHDPNGPIIVFEILESVLVEEQGDLFHFGLDRLRDAGVKVEIDDFGSGHASIVGLMQLQPDAMKIDQRLIRPITSDPLARGLLGHIVGMADLMDLTIIAEGVETMEHAMILRDIGCHTLQGFAFCKPLPLEELRAFILQHEARLSLRALGS